MNEIIANEKYINEKTFWNYFKYQNPSFLAKDLIRTTQAKNEQLVNTVKNRLIDLRNVIIRKKITENVNPNKIVDIVEKILDFNKQQKAKGIKLLTPKQMIQRLLIEKAVKAGNTSENVLNEICQITYSLYREKDGMKTWNKEFEFPHGSYSVSDIRKYFEYILKEHGAKINDNNPSLKIYINKIENRITFKIKTGYYRELLMHETRKLLESIKSKITKHKNGENVPHLEISEVVLIHCNIVNNNFQQDSRVLHAFVPNKSFGQLLGI